MDSSLKKKKKSLQSKSLPSPPYFVKRKEGICLCELQETFSDLNKREPTFSVKLPNCDVHQGFVAQWEYASSEMFRSSNGIRQDGILSADLCNVTTDDLDVILGRENVRCFIANTCFNSLGCVDEMMLSAPFTDTLQRVINRNQAFAADCIMADAVRTVCVVTPPKNS